MSRPDTPPSRAVSTADQSQARARGPWTCAAVILFAAAKAAMKVGRIRVAARISDQGPFVIRELADREALQHPFGIHNGDPQSLVLARAPSVFVVPLPGSAVKSATTGAAPTPDFTRHADEQRERVGFTEVDTPK